MFGENKHRLRTTRVPFTFNKPSKSQKPSVRTRFAICLLCLFDGLRMPSIRKLSRKPLYVFNEPLLTLNPTCFAPKSKSAVHDIYIRNMEIMSEMSIDPTISNIDQLLKVYCSNYSHERVILHYLGQGSLPPTREGMFYVFNDNRTAYKAIKVSNLLERVKSPLCAIFDCSKSGLLAPHFEGKFDVFCFFSCSRNETLHVSTDTPWDLFSNCLLSPYDTAIWWHLRGQEFCCNREKVLDKNTQRFLNNLLNGILSSILFDGLNEETYDTITRDPAMFTLFKGFLVAQRVLLNFNVHPDSIPKIGEFSGHGLWYFWDTALDCAYSHSECDLSMFLYDTFMTSFSNYIVFGYIPMFSFFCRYCNANESSLLLFNILDKDHEAVKEASRSGLVHALLKIYKPSESVLLLVTKILSVGFKRTPFQNQWPFWFAHDDHTHIKEIKIGMLAIMISIHYEFISCFTKMYDVCIARASDCSPYSALLLGLLLERAGRLMNLPAFGHHFYDLLDRSEGDIIASLYLLGNARDKGRIGRMLELTKHSNEIIRALAMWSVSFIDYENESEMNYKETLRKIEGEDSELVKECIQDLIKENFDDARNRIRILERIVSRVKADDFITRYRDNSLFDFK